MHAQQTQFSTQQESWTAQIKKKRLHKKDFFFLPKLGIKEKQDKKLTRERRTFSEKKNIGMIFYENKAFKIKNKTEAFKIKETAMHDQN